MTPTTTGANVTRAAELFATAAAEGSVEAMCALAWLHLQGADALVGNATLAREWYARALAHAPSVAFAAPAVLGLVVVALFEAARVVQGALPGPWGALGVGWAWHVRLLGGWARRAVRPGWTVVGWARGRVVERATWLSSALVCRMVSFGC